MLRISQQNKKTKQEFKFYQDFKKIQAWDIEI